MKIGLEINKFKCKQHKNALMQVIGIEIFLYYELRQK